MKHKPKTELRYFGFQGSAQSSAGSALPGCATTLPYFIG